MPVVVASLLTIGASAIFNTPELHKEFAKECAIAQGWVKKLNSTTFCVDIKTVPDVIWMANASGDDKYKITHECVIAGGVILDLSNNNNDKGCYKLTIIEELGARRDYTGGQ